ncbi:MAG TPA: DNA alkylation repair protein [Fluviicola sp.]|nr:DNA alkylation repair protein [Fluviicola sp.]
MNTKEKIDDCIDVLKKDFELHLNKEKARQMKAYMKNHFDFYGIQSPLRKSIQKSWLDALKSVEPTLKWDIIHALFAQKEREFQLVAIDWLNKSPKKNIQETDIEHIEKLLLTKSWWDSVDAIASNFVGTWAKHFPQSAQNIIQKWRYSDNIWLQRTCLIFQLKYKNETNVALLEDLIAQLHPNKTFFIQKAIGWTLRELSKTNPEETERILCTYPIVGLAKREASKYL